MLNTIIFYTFVTAIVAMLLTAIVKIKKDQTREERDYWIQECAIREREAQMDERLVPRIMSRFGNSMQDYLIDRHLRNGYEDAYAERVIEQEEDEEPQRPFFVGNSLDEDDPIVGYNITESNPVVRQSDVVRMEAKRKAEEQRNRDKKPTSYKLASDYIKPTPKEEKAFFKQHELMKDDFWEDSTAYDWANEEDEEILISEHPTSSKVIPFSKATSGTGRPKIYSSPAAKQQAYRERLKQRHTA